MTKRYYSSRNSEIKLSREELHKRVYNLIKLFIAKDYFRQNLGVTSDHIPVTAEQESIQAIGVVPYPFINKNYGMPSVNEEFNIIEFFYRHISKPGKQVAKKMSVFHGFELDVLDYLSYNAYEGKQEFRERLNSFLCDFDEGFELNEEGEIFSLGGSLKDILIAEIIEFDEENVDSKVRNAIKKWRNRELSLDVRREAIREMADVFEWLQKNHDLSSVMDKKDEHDLFNIANNFAIRHHNPKQKSNYDMSIWYPWIFHFYLATYHATVRLLKKNGVS